MKSTPRLTRLAAALAAGLALAAAVPASASPGPGFREMTPEMTERMRDHMQARLDRMAERLEIKASQQDAWKAYAKVHQDMFDGSIKPAPKDADAAAIVRHRADTAALMAKKLATLADATAELQKVLTPEQNKLLAGMVRRPMGGRFGGPGEHGRHGGFGGPR